MWYIKKREREWKWINTYILNFYHVIDDQNLTYGIECIEHNENVKDKNPHLSQQRVKENK